MQLTYHQGRMVLGLFLALFLLLGGCSPGGGGEGLDEAAIYAAVIREQITEDDTFGGALKPSPVYLVSTTDDTVGDPEAEKGETRTLSAELREAIAGRLSDLRAELVWVESREAVPVEPETGRLEGGGAIVTVGNLHPQGEGSVHVSSSIYVAGLAAGGQTYVVEEVDGTWTVTGNTGVQWIS